MSRFFQKYVPSPFSIAILLTLLTFVLALLFTRPTDASVIDYSSKLALDWQAGLWDTSSGGLYFAFQMMLILILGHCLALTPLVAKLLDKLIFFCNDTASSALTVAMATMLVSYFNWGMGLIFGALLARKVGEKFSQNNRELNYGLIGAAAYSGMLIWHGGISGSAPTKAMEENSIRDMMTNAGYTTAEQIPLSVTFEETLFSPLNMSVSITMLLVIPLLLYFIGKKTTGHTLPIAFKDAREKIQIPPPNEQALDGRQWFGATIGILFILVAILVAWNYEGATSTGFISVNFINFSLLGLALLLHGSIRSFLRGIDQSISDASGILIQFPLYFGIMGIMSGSGLIHEISNFLVATSSVTSFPILSFIGAGVINFFVPSGGGQWYIQGPMLIQTALEIGVSLPKTIMALSYGDQWTNMLQPFWALPLLGITKLKAGEILPYTIILFIAGGIVFMSMLLIF